MKKKYLTLYYRWMIVGEIPSDGLCFSLNDPFSDKQDQLLEFFVPTPEEYDTNGYRLWQCFWAADGVSQRDPLQLCKFTPLRQNIVLLMAAMNGEL